MKRKDRMVSRPMQTRKVAQRLSESGVIGVDN